MKFIFVNGTTALYKLNKTKSSITRYFMSYYHFNLFVK